MSDSQSISGIVIKYLLQWAIGFGLLYWWIKDDAEKQWYWGVAIGVCLVGLVLMLAVKKIGDKAADALSNKLMEDLSADSTDKNEQ